MNHNLDVYRIVRSGSYFDPRGGNLGKCIVVMGVSGSGKSTVGKKIADTLGAKFIDGDDLHPRANIDKMASGNALTDSDRAPWLERINDAATVWVRKMSMASSCALLSNAAIEILCGSATTISSSSSSMANLS